MKEKKREKKPLGRKKMLLIGLGAVCGFLALLLVAAVLFINSKMNLLNRSASYGTVDSIAEEEPLSFDHLDLDYIDDATMRPVRLPKEAPPESLKDTQDGSVK